MTDEKREQLEMQYTASKIEGLEELQAEYKKYVERIEEILKDCPDPDIKERQREQAIYEGQAVYLEGVEKIAGAHPDWDKLEVETLEELRKNPEYIRLEEECKYWETAARIFEHPEK